MSSSTGWSPSKGSKIGVSIPSFVQRSFANTSNNRRASIGSFSDRLSTDISIGDLEAFDEKQPYSPSDATGSSAYIATPIDGNEDRKGSELARPDSGVVVDIEVITDMDRRSVDVPKSVRDDSHMV